jgi:hypothetical protein
MTAAPASAVLSAFASQRRTLVRSIALPPDRIAFQPWSNLPPGSGETAKLCGDFVKPLPGDDAVVPRFCSAPDSYATDRIQVVVSETGYQAG